MSLKHYLRDRRGVASIEAALGTVAILTASALALDLYRLSSTQTTTLHAAVTLADTVSRDDQLEAGFVQTLAGFLHQGAVPHLECRFCGLRGVQEPRRPRSFAHRALDRNGRARPGRRSGAYADLVQWGGGNQYRYAEQSSRPAGRIYHVAQRTRHRGSGVRRAGQTLPWPERCTPTTSYLPAPIIWRQIWVRPVDG